MPMLMLMMMHTKSHLKAIKSYIKVKIAIPQVQSMCYGSARVSYPEAVQAVVDDQL